MKLIRKVIIRKIFSARAQDKREDLEKCLCDILIQSWSTEFHFLFRDPRKRERRGF